MKRRHQEDDWQIGIVKDLRQYEKLGLLNFCHVPNQLGRTPTLRMIFSALGLKAGVSDLLIFLKGGVTLFIELKVEKRPQSTAQKAWEASVTALGFKYYLVRMADKMDGRRQIKEILQENGIG